MASTASISLTSHFTFYVTCLILFSLCFRWVQSQVHYHVLPRMRCSARWVSSERFNFGAQQWEAGESERTGPPPLSLPKHCAPSAEESSILWSLLCYLIFYAAQVNKIFFTLPTQAGTPYVQQRLKECSLLGAFMNNIFLPFHTHINIIHTLSAPRWKSSLSLKWARRSTSRFPTNPWNNIITTRAIIMDARIQCLLLRLK